MSIPRASSVSDALALFARCPREREATVPVDDALRSTTSVMAKVVARRRMFGDDCRPEARVFLHGGQLFAVVEYGAPRPDLVFALQGFARSGKAGLKVGEAR